MTASLVIEHLDVIEQLHRGFAEAVEAVGELALHGREKLSCSPRRRPFEQAEGESGWEAGSL